MQIGEPMAYNIVFYEKQNGESELWNFLEKLRKKSATNKDARIQYKQASLYIELLQNNGTQLPDTVTKHIEDNIWELRPGNNRIFYFFCDKNDFVLLIASVKRRKKHLVAKSKKQNPSGMIIYQERSPEP